jgi:hypothetical protein
VPTPRQARGDRPGRGLRHHTHRDPLYGAWLALASQRFRAGATRTTGGSTVSDDSGRLLAWLSRNAPADGWLAVGPITGLAQAVDMPRRSRKRVVARTVARGFVERRPADPDGWPAEIRLAAGRLEAALVAADGLNCTVTR